MNAPLPYTAGSTFDVQDTTEFRRVLGLPRRDWNDTVTQNDLHKRMTQAFKLPGGQFELHYEQAAALAEAHDYKGLFAPLPPGTGKTLLSYLLPVVIPGIKRPTLLLKAGLVEKTWREFQQLQRHFVCHQEFFKRKTFDECVVSYESLGRDSNKDVLMNRRPDIVIADEADLLSNIHSARTRRMSRFMTAFPSTIFCGMTGTPTKRSVLDYWHLLYWALRHNMPLPRDYTEAEKWAEVLDERKTEAISRRGPGVLMNFCTDKERAEAEPQRTAPIGRTQQMPVFGFQNRLVVARKGYQRRLRETPGVVCSSDARPFIYGTKTPVALQIRRINIEPSPLITQHLKILREKPWTTPNGDILTQPAQVWQHAREIATGFYYVWWNQEKFNEWLGAVKNVELTRNAQRLLQGGGLRTGRDTELVKALANLRVGKNINANAGLRFGMASPSNTTNNYSQNTLGAATFANGTAYTTPECVDQNVSRLITITKQGASAGFSAHLATERLQCWETILRASPALCTMFSESVDAAAPPDEWRTARSHWNWLVREILQPDGSLHDEFKHLNLDSPMQVALAVTGSTQKTRTFNRDDLEDAATNAGYDPDNLPEGVDLEDLRDVNGKYLTELLTPQVGAVQQPPRITRVDIVAAYHRWAAVRGTYKINTVAEWLDDTVLRYCLDWFRANGSGIVWTEHRAFGEKLAALAGTGFCSQGGEDANGRPIEEYNGAPVVASVQANHQGRNLQAWYKNLIVTCPPTGRLIEQLLARSHRQGQRQPRVYVDWIAACSEQDDGMSQMMADARYIEGTLTEQRLLYAEHV